MIGRHYVSFTGWRDHGSAPSASASRTEYGGAVGTLVEVSVRVGDGLYFVISPEDAAALAAALTEATAEALRLEREGTASK